jgi:hypothetical protein
MAAGVAITRNIILIPFFYCECMNQKTLPKKFIELFGVDFFGEVLSHAERERERGFFICASAVAAVRPLDAAIRPRAKIDRRIRTPMSDHVQKLTGGFGRQCPPSFSS